MATRSPSGSNAADAPPPPTQRTAPGSAGARNSSKEEGTDEDLKAAERLREAPAPFS